MLINSPSSVDWVIYKIINPENKIYIGRTKNIEKRKKSHFNPTQYRNPPVLQYDLNGEFIKEFESIKAAAKSVNTTSTSHIGEACRGERFMYKKYIWKFKTK